MKWPFRKRAEAPSHAAAADSGAVIGVYAPTAELGPGGKVAVISVGEVHPLAHLKTPPNTVYAHTVMNGTVGVDIWYESPTDEEIRDLSRRVEVLGLSDNPAMGGVYLLLAFADDSGSIRQPLKAVLGRGTDTSTLGQADFPSFLVTLNDHSTDAVCGIRRVPMPLALRDHLCDALARANTDAVPEINPDMEMLLEHAKLWQFEPDDPNAPNPVFAPFASGEFVRRH